MLNKNTFVVNLRSFHSKEIPDDTFDMLSNKNLNILDSGILKLLRIISKIIMRKGIESRNIDIIRNITGNSFDSSE
jgi:hypothetical protein